MSSSDVNLTSSWFEEEVMVKGAVIPLFHIINRTDIELQSIPGRETFSVDFEYRRLELLQTPFEIFKMTQIKQ